LTRWRFGSSFFSSTNIASMAVVKDQEFEAMAKSV